MSMIPLIVNLANELDNSPDYYRGLGDLDNLLDDDFGFGIHPMEIFRSRIGGHPHSALTWHPRRRFSPYDRHWLAKRLGGRRRSSGNSDGESGTLLPTVGKDGFQVCMDVSQFKPNELNVKTVDKTIVVEGKHEEREDNHGLIQRHFVRKYTLPKEYDPKDVVSTISSDGILTVKAPPPPSAAIKSNERVVQIQQTGPAHLNVKAPATSDQQQKGGKKGQSQNGEELEKMETSK